MYKEVICRQKNTFTHRFDFLAVLGGENKDRGRGRNTAVKEAEIGVILRAVRIHCDIQLTCDGLSDERQE